MYLSFVLEKSDCHILETFDFHADFSGFGVQVNCSWSDLLECIVDFRKYSSL